MKISHQEAVERLSHSEVVAIPTETVWGLAAMVSKPEAINKIFHLKNRPLKNPLIIHIASQKELYQFLKPPYPPFLQSLIDTFWPGPLTLVLPVQEEKIDSRIRANLPTAAFRIPKFEPTRALIEETGPLVAPSANISGKPSATLLEHVERDFGQELPCFFPEVAYNADNHGVESTILIWIDSAPPTSSSRNGSWHIGRLGATSTKELEKVIQTPLQKAPTTSKKPLCPGSMFRHYAPEASLTIYENNEIFSPTTISQFDALIGFSDRDYPKTAHFFSLGPSSSIQEVLKNLYRILRLLDKHHIRSAAVDCSILKNIQENDPLWQVYFDRIHKAAHK